MASGGVDKDKDGAPAFGEMTRAWFNAADQVAELEAGERAERKRILIAVAGSVVVFSCALALLFILG